MGEVIAGPWSNGSEEGGEDGGWCIVCGAPVEPLVLMCDTCEREYRHGT